MLKNKIVHNPIPKALAWALVQCIFTRKNYLMKPTHILISLFCLCFTFLQAQHPWPPEGEEGKDHFINNKSEPKPDGLHYRTYDNGNVYYSGVFEDGHPKAGTKLFYYSFEDNGAVIAVHEFTDDITKVKAKNYFNSGEIKSVGQYVNRKKEGAWTFYNVRGEVTSIDEFAADSLHGVSKTFYPSGKQFQQLEYNNGAKDGDWIEWFEDGRVKLRAGYKQDNFHGSYEQNHGNGIRMIQGEYVNG
ncbi:MAG: hypothetical protein HKN32_08660, partial [Flavobacteriales bacterium]|nr:hypothetical protein [Flavobacteriales bacterium]